MIGGSIIAKKRISELISANKIIELNNNYKFNFEYKNKSFLLKGKKLFLRVQIYKLVLL